ncbi:hypothetical protein GL213_00125 [Halogeometricum borinquense]|uniref:DUF7979 domain-containing protein n=1 Tax=Halogeometricum borinquense TaxID=60847 RepID=A0A6C0UCD2_9EURY|nr:hypothetical protein [Halogeometricum borinquense]QIB72952.1 hypothetical protein G3I44_00820 [Halogeometricum borinquense]QIQ75088.1 hypothetical protein GL213_00125 [Halogeometricum borinquense]
MDRFVLAFTLLIGVLLVASPLYILPHATVSSYRYTIQSVDEDVETAPVVYSNLPQSAQNTFDSARSTDGVVVKQTTDPAFEPGRSVVTDGDEQYVVRTVREPPSTVLRWLRQALVTFGVVLCCSVGVTLRDGADRRTGPPIGFAVVGFGAVITAVTGVGTGAGAVLLLTVVIAQFAALWWAVATATGRIVPQPIIGE